MGNKIIIAGGGTGGHIFPAIAIANELKRRRKDIEIFFVGAKGKMEMDKVPQAGYRIQGLDIAGFNRSSLIKNLTLPFKLLRSFLQVRSIFRREKPDAVIGVGGYSSFPVLRTAQARGIPTFIHESNSFAGRSNRMLARKARAIFTGTAGMEKFFPSSKIVVTGNPVRKSILSADVTRDKGLEFFGLEKEKKTILVVGGSQGARSINEAVHAGLETLVESGLQLVWQTGRPYAAKAKLATVGKKGIWVDEFITQMEYAYSAADVVVARSGAMTVAELCVVKKPVLFVPYPFAAEDHQTVNARQLVERGAALMIPDAEAGRRLVPELVLLAQDDERQQRLREAMAPLAITDADERIAEEILKHM